MSQQALKSISLLAALHQHLSKTPPMQRRQAASRGPSNLKLTFALATMHRRPLIPPVAHLLPAKQIVWRPVQEGHAISATAAASWGANGGDRGNLPSVFPVPSVCPLPSVHPPIGADVAPEVQV